MWPRWVRSYQYTNIFCRHTKIYTLQQSVCNFCLSWWLSTKSTVHSAIRSPSSSLVRQYCVRINVHASRLISQKSNVTALSPRLKFTSWCSQWLRDYHYHCLYLPSTMLMCTHIVHVCGPYISFIPVNHENNCYGNTKIAMPLSQQLWPQVPAFCRLGRKKQNLPQYSQPLICYKTCLLNHFLVCRHIRVHTQTDDMLYSFRYHSW